MMQFVFNGIKAIYGQTPTVYLNQFMHIFTHSSNHIIRSKMKGSCWGLLSKWPEGNTLRDSKANLSGWNLKWSAKASCLLIMWRDFYRECGIIPLGYTNTLSRFPLSYVLLLIAKCKVKMKCFFYLMMSQNIHDEKDNRVLLLWALVGVFHIAVVHSVKCITTVRVETLKHHKRYDVVLPYDSLPYANLP